MLLSWVRIGLLGAALAFGGCNGETAEPDVNPTVVVRDFADGPFGQIHYRRMGPVKDAAKTPVVLLHPSPFSSLYYSVFMPQMAADRLVIAIDTPGFGDSALPPEPQTLESYASAIVAALDGLGFGKGGKGAVDIIGYHTGSLLGAEVAAQRPDLARRLVLPGIPYQTGEKQRKSFEENAKPQALKEDGSHLDKHWAFVKQRLKDGISIERVQGQYGDMMQAVPNQWWAYYGVFSHDSTPVLKGLTQPTLFLTTSGSLRAETQAAAAIMPNAKIIDLPHLKHGIFDVAAPELAAIMRDFLDSETP